MANMQPEYINIKLYKPFSPTDGAPWSIKTNEGKVTSAVSYILLDFKSQNRSYARKKMIEDMFLDVLSKIKTGSKHLDIIESEFLAVLSRDVKDMTQLGICL
ncbi:hypothetical protein Ancab_036462 [Ancistrocladus abbreviatus]